jgi:beta-N-acetylhexosaminidase
VRPLVRRVGQRFLVGFEGQAASPDVKALIREFGVGGIVLFARNVADPTQLAELVRELQGLARDAGHERPLLVAVDQEGGRVARLREPWTVWPPARAVGRTESVELARRVGQAIGEELAACGIRYDFAPCVDVDTNPKNPVIGDRSFGPDPELVGRLGVATIEGLQASGVAAAAKHFPGHGDTELDSHHDLPAVDHSRSRLEDVELRPFRAAVAAGVASVMTSHIVVRELDDARPATLSHAVITGLLRGELGYDGVVVTDDLEMKAVAARYTPGEIAVGAAKAGCDLLEFCKTADVQVPAIEALVRACESGEIPFKEAEAAEARVQAFKDRFLAGYRDPEPRLAREVAGSAAHRALAEQVAVRSGLFA